MRLRGLVGSLHSVSLLSCLFKYPNDCLNAIYDGTLAPQAKTTNNKQKQNNSQQPTNQAANNDAKPVRVAAAAFSSSDYMCL
jgi:hypothetical protein